MHVPDWYLRLLQILTWIIAVGAVLVALFAITEAIFFDEGRMPSVILGAVSLIVGVYLLAAESLFTKFARAMERWDREADEASRKLDEKLRRHTTRKR